MWGVLLGHIEPPMEFGIATLAEVANAYYARACEIEKHILQEEREGRIRRGDPMYRYRTGELRSFLNAAKRRYELGSRRITESLKDRQWNEPSA